MADDISITGANKLAAVTRRLKATGQSGLKRDMLRGLRAAAKPLPEVARASALETLPKKGGLNEVVASQKFAVRTRTSGRNPGVRVVGVSKEHLRAMDAGRLSHPVFGNRNVWVKQKIKPGWWTVPLTAQAPAVRARLLAVLAETARKIEHG